MDKKIEVASAKDEWDGRFKEGGKFETEWIDGRLQTRLFAEAFCRHTRLELQNGHTLLDSSCALGDVLPAFRQRFPGVKLYGCDISSRAIRRCREGQLRNLATFFDASLEDISQTYDAIYSSNTLEHLPDYKEKVRSLLRHCRYLCILVPYDETRLGKDLEWTGSTIDHVVTFRKDSFDFLIDEGIAQKISRSRPFLVPRAWSYSFRWSVRNSIKNIIRVFIGRPVVRNRREILFEIERAD